MAFFKIAGRRGFGRREKDYTVSGWKAVFSFVVGVFFSTAGVLVLRRAPPVNSFVAGRLRAGAGKVQT